jgi:hypothetical protein
MGLASASISRGTGIQNTNYGINALGDQTINFFDTLGASATGVLHDNLFGTPTTGFIYLTNINVNVEVKGAVGSVIWQLKSTGAAGTLYNFNSPVTSPQYQNILNMSGMNIKLDAAQKWQLFVSTNTYGANSVVLNHTFNWTQNPQ